MNDLAIAVYGAGHLGAALIAGFHRARIAPIVIFNRSYRRAAAVAANYDGCYALESLRELLNGDSPLLLTIPGDAILSVPEEVIQSFRQTRRVVVYCAGGLPIAVVESRFPEVAWVRAVPAMTAAIGRGVTLLGFGRELSAEQRERVRALFDRVGQTRLCESDEQIDNLACLTSCFPGLLATLLDEWARAYTLDAVGRATLLESALATALLLEHTGEGFAALADEVATSGGLTSVGAAVLREKLPVFLGSMKNAMEDKSRRRREDWTAAESRR